MFGCLFLTVRNQLIRDEDLFHGSIDGTKVYPRVILQKALALNAGAVIAYHNHSSAVADPLECDKHLTRRVRDLLCEIDLLLVDHIVVSRTGSLSMADLGLI